MKPKVNWENMQNASVRLSRKVGNDEENGSGFLISGNGYFITTLHGLEDSLGSFGTRGTWYP